MRFYSYFIYFVCFWQRKVRFIARMQFLCHFWCSVNGWQLNRQIVWMLRMCVLLICYLAHMIRSEQNKEGHPGSRSERRVDCRANHWAVSCPQQNKLKIRNIITVTTSMEEPFFEYGCRELWVCTMSESILKRPPLLPLILSQDSQ